MDDFFFDDVALPATPGRKKHSDAGWEWEAAKSNYMSGFGEVGGLMRRGLDKIGIGDYMGEHSAEEYAQRMKAQGEQERQMSSAPQTWDDMKFGENFGQYLRQGAIGSAPYIAEAVVTAPLLGATTAARAVGATGVRALGDRAAVKAAESVLAKASAEELASGVAHSAARAAALEAREVAMRQGARSAGLMAGTYPSAVGDVLGNQREEGTGEHSDLAALGLGVPYAAMNLMGLEGLAGGVQKFARGGVARGAAAAATTMGGEALNETGQEVMNQFGRMAVNPEQTLINEESLKRFKESAIMGGLLGGAGGSLHIGSAALRPQVDETGQRSTDLLQQYQGQYDNALDLEAAQALGFPSNEALQAHIAEAPERQAQFNAIQEMQRRAGQQPSLGLQQGIDEATGISQKPSGLMKGKGFTDEGRAYQDWWKNAEYPAPPVDPTQTVFAKQLAEQAKQRDTLIQIEEGKASPNPDIREAALAMEAKLGGKNATASKVVPKRTEVQTSSVQETPGAQGKAAKAETAQGVPAKSGKSRVEDLPPWQATLRDTALTSVLGAEDSQQKYSFKAQINKLVRGAATPEEAIAKLEARLTEHNNGKQLSEPVHKAVEQMRNALGAQIAAKKAAATAEQELVIPEMLAAMSAEDAKAIPAADATNPADQGDIALSESNEPSLAEFERVARAALARFQAYAKDKKKPEFTKQQLVANFKALPTTKHLFSGAQEESYTDLISRVAEEMESPTSRRAQQADDNRLAKKLKEYVKSAGSGVEERVGITKILKKHGLYPAEPTKSEQGKDTYVRPALLILANKLESGEALIADRDIVQELNDAEQGRIVSVWHEAAKQEMRKRGAQWTHSFGNKNARMIQLFLGLNESWDYTERDEKKPPSAREVADMFNAEYNTNLSTSDVLKNLRTLFSVIHGTELSKTDPKTVRSRWDEITKQFQLDMEELQQEGKETEEAIPEGGEQATNIDSQYKSNERKLWTEHLKPEHRRALADFLGTRTSEETGKEEAVQATLNNFQAKVDELWGKYEVEQQWAKEYYERINTSRAAAFLDKAWLERMEQRDKAAAAKDYERKLGSELAKEERRATVAERRATPVAERVAAKKESAASTPTDPFAEGSDEPMPKDVRQLFADVWEATAKALQTRFGVKDIEGDFFKLPAEQQFAFMRAAMAREAGAIKSNSELYRIVKDNILGEVKPDMRFIDKSLHGQKVSSWNYADVRTAMSKHMKKLLDNKREAAEQKAEDAGVKKATGPAGLSLMAELKKWGFSAAKLAGVVYIHDTAAQAKAATGVNKNLSTVQGFYQDGKVHLIASNIKPDEGLAVLLHEAGAHLGMERLIGTDNMRRLVTSIKQWAKDNDGSKRSELAKKAVARAERSSSAKERLDEEFIAYFVEESVNAGITPKSGDFSVRNWLRQWMNAARATLKQFFGLNSTADITPEHIVNLAFGAAHLSMENRVEGGKGFAEAGVSAEDLAEIMALLNEDPTATLGVKELTDEELDAAETLFLSDLKAGTRKYYGRNHRLAKGVRAASDAAANDLGGKATTERVSDSPLGMFSGYRTVANIDEDGTLNVEVWGKEQVEAGLKDEPALTFNITPDGTMIVNGPSPLKPTFKEFEKRGWAVPATAEGEVAPGWTRLVGTAKGGKLPGPQVLKLLGDVHARARLNKNVSHIGLHWERATGMLGLSDKNGGAALFSEAPSIKGIVDSDTAYYLRSGAKNIAQTAIDHLKFFHQIVKDAAPLLPSVKKFDAARTKVAVMTAELQQEVKAVVDLTAPLSKLKDAKKEYEAVNKLIADSTWLKKWAYFDQAKGLGGKDTDAGLVKQYQALSPEGQAIVRGVFEHSKKMLGLQRTIIKALGADNLFAKNFGNADTPYAPFRRYGNFITVVKSAKLRAAEAKVKTSDTAANRAALEELKRNYDDYQVMRFETKAAAQVEARKWERKGMWADAFERNERLTSHELMDNHILQRLMSAVDVSDSLEGEAKTQMQAMVRDMYLQSLDEMNARQASARRLNRHGFEKDMIRAFSDHGTAQAYLLANMQHGGEVNAHFYKMQQEVKDDTDHRGAADMLNLITKHYAKDLDYKETPWHDKITSTATIWQLLTSPAYHIANSLQGIMVTIPRLAADFDNYSGAWKHFTAAYAFTKGVSKQGGWNGIDLDKIKDKGLREAIQYALDTKQLDLGMAEDVDALKTFRGMEGRVAHAIHLLRNTNRTVELWNRMATAVASYNMARENKKSEAEAKEYMLDMIRDTQGDFTRPGAPLLIKNLPKPVVQYRKYQLLMGAVYAKAFAQVWGGIATKDKELYRLGMSMLKYKLMHSFVGAGAMGTPYMAAAGLVYSVAAALTGGDEPPEDLERVLKKYAKDNAFLDFLMKGPLGYAGINMTPKLGEDKIFSVAPYVDFTAEVLKGKQGVANIILGLSGPAASLAGKWADGAALMADGKYEKGTEKMLPRGFEMALQSYRYANEGFTTRTGTALVNPEDISGMALALNAIGIPATQLTDIGWLRGQQFEIDNYFKERTARIEHDYKDGDLSKTEAIEQWKQLQDSKDDLRWLYNSQPDALKKHPLSQLLKYPANKAKADEKKRRAFAVG